MYQTYQFIATVTTDDGPCDVKIKAAGDLEARYKLADSGYTRRDITALRAVDADGFELSLADLTKRRTIRAGTYTLKTRVTANTQNRPNKVNTKWEILLPHDKRHRRVYQVRDSVYYVIDADLKVVIEIPEGA